MRTLTAAEEKIVGADSAERIAKARVSIKDSGGTFRDLSTYPEEDFVKSVSWEENIDSPGMTATVILRRAAGEKSLSPLHSTSPLNKGWNSAASPVALLAVAREIKIEAAVCGPEGVAGTYIEVFRGYVDSVDWPDEEVELRCAGIEAKLRDTWIEKERIYAYANESDCQNGVRAFAVSTAYSAGEWVCPSQENVNGYAYYVTVGGTTAATEPTWPTTLTNTVTSGGVTFRCEITASTSAGCPVEEVMSFIVGDHNLGGVATPSSPSWAVKWFLQRRESVLSAINALAEQIGWCCRAKWDSGLSQFEMTFYDPNRSKTTPDRTFAPGAVLEVSQIGIRIADIRNAVRVIYSDSANLDPGGTPVRTTVEVTDSASITAYGRRFMEVAESSASNIDTSTEATRLANAILSDLAQPTAEVGVALQFFPWVELTDLIRLTANNIHFTTDLDVAVVSVRHEINATSARTSLQCRGKPSGGFEKWLARAGEAKPADVHVTTVAESLAIKAVKKEVIPGGLRVTSPAEAGGTAPKPRKIEMHVSKTPNFTPNVLTLVATGEQVDVVMPELEPGETYYMKRVPLLRNAERTARGLPSVEDSFIAGRNKAIHYDSTSTQGHLPLNGNFEHATRAIADKPPDHWEVSALGGETESYASSGSVWHGTDTDKGRYLTLRAHASQRGRILSSPFEVRRGVRALNIYLSIRRQTGSGSGSPYDLIVDVFGYKDAALTAQVVNYSVWLSGSASGAYPSLATWYDAVIDFGGGYGAVPSNVNFLQLAIRRSTAGSTAVAWDIGDVYVNEADFYRAAIDNIIQPAWVAVGTTPGFNTGWGNYGGSWQGAEYYKDPMGIVHLRGLVKRSSGSATIIFTLPSGHRPASDITFPTSSNAAFANVDINTYGNVIIVGGSPTVDVSLNGITFDTR